MQHLRLFLLPFTAAVLLSACVSSKKYRAELSSREQCESREKVLVKELMDRKKETADLIKQVGDLNRMIGSQDAELRDLKVELTARTQQMGESSGKLATEISDLKKDLTGKNAKLTKCEGVLQGLSSTQKSRQNILDELKNALLSRYPASTGATLDMNEYAVLLTLPDNGLFETTGLNISPTGKDLLAPLAGLLANRPELDVDVLAYTDNVLPKGIKNMADTWDWSLARATNLVRLLIRDFNINANQLTPVAKGEFYPLSSNETPEGRQKNRRTVLVVYPNLPKVPFVD